MEMAESTSALQRVVAARTAQQRLLLPIYRPARRITIFRHRAEQYHTNDGKTHTSVCEHMYNGKFVHRYIALTKLFICTAWNENYIIFFKFYCYFFIFLLSRLLSYTTTISRRLYTKPSWNTCTKPKQ